MSNCLDILRSMPKIEVLTFECLKLDKTSASAIIPKRLPELLGNLKTVNLYDMDALKVHQMSFMFCIIRSSPNLQHLNIHISRLCRIHFGKDSLKAAAIAYLEDEAIEEIKTSITTVSVTFKRLYYEGCFGAEIAFSDSIVSCCPAR